MTDYIAKIISELNRVGINEKQIIYALGLLESVNEKHMSCYEYLHNTKEYDEYEDSIEVILEYLAIFENIIDVNYYQDSDNAKVNRLVSQLVNINSLSRSLSHRALSNIKYQLIRLREEYFNSYIIPSAGFSQEGEDVVLRRLFTERKKGFFVDIGAHHPTKFSNTYYFYLRGWRGINIDAMPGSMEMFEVVRPEDINVQVAVGFRESDKEFADYIIFKEPAYNCLIFDREERPENFQKSEIVDIVKVPVKRLDEILEQYSDKFESIDLLSIDVEGAEEFVFKGFTIDKFLPEKIVIEIRGFSLERSDDFPIYRKLNAAGYRLRSVLFHSLIFERVEK